MAMDLKEVIQYINGGSWLSLAVVKADEKRGAAGEILRLAKCRMARRRPNATDRKLLQEQVRANPTAAKNPHHWWNSTINVELPNGRIRTIHPLFIFELNGRAVI